jgi:hypothetical protein
VVIPTIADNTPPTPPRATPEIIRDRLTTLLLLVLPKLLVLVQAAVAIEHDGQLVERPLGC